MSRRASVILLAVLVAIVAAVIIDQRRNAAESDRITDTYYCTLAGVSQLDRGPETGIRCIDLLEDE